MSQGLLLKKKEQHLQHQLMLQQQQINQHHSFPSPITPGYDKKALASPTSSSSSSCRFDTLNGNSTTVSTTEVTSSASLYSSPTSSSASTPSSAHSTSSSQRYGQYPFGDIYGTSGNFLSSSYASAAALGSHHDLTRSSCSALPSPTIYPPTPPPSSTPWLHHAWFGSMEAAGYMKTPKNNPFDN
ncbi:hypothetical protein PVAND_002188 [Polypedilum vanderplanki]|uniref:Uncharacterized protein n=1 Tax=Polypedilum vanderplanki TaxID=319348 RepID=A0A9J6BQK2_POLVA|nr:hypothetical protein PVAND_002188 [Polypedilum vanderplanki]